MEGVAARAEAVLAAEFAIAQAPVSPASVRAELHTLCHLLAIASPIVVSISVAAPDLMLPPCLLRWIKSAAAEIFYGLGSASDRETAVELTALAQVAGGDLVMTFRMNRLPSAPAPSEPGEEALVRADGILSALGGTLNLKLGGNELEAIARFPLPGLGRKA